MKEIAGPAAGLVPFVWEKIAAFAAEKQHARGLLAALRFELSANIDLLAVIKTEALKEAKIGDSAFRALAENLRTEAAASILFSPNRANYRRFRRLLEKYFADAACFDLPEGETGADAPSRQSVFYALSYAVRKIETLKTLGRLSPTPEELYINVNLPLRVERIHQSLLALNGIIRKIAEDV
jgi:hypothetical protein